eukprot:TRINITY_DN52190_c0_g1_i1.p1 TRINITY_DN52190_c0_g1~~TRINITY_DN52190_c0_g1_i1.p1  ORF type:complete len:192 (-),score=4.12 TRINITY_DN52190_c0_g1_i1:334-909(-)
MTRWRPPEGGDINLVFRCGEVVPAHRDKLSEVSFFEALLNRGFAEGVSAYSQQRVSLNEDWAHFQVVLHAIYDGDCADLELSPDNLTTTLAVADRCGIDVAVTASLHWIRRHLTPDIFYSLEPLLCRDFAFAAAVSLRRSVFHELGKRDGTLMAVVDDPRWQDTSRSARRSDRHASKPRGDSRVRAIQCSR